MARLALVSSLAVTLLACGFDTGGVMSGGASIGSVGEDDTGADDADVDDGPGPGSDPDAEAGDPSTTSASSDPTSADGDPTTDQTSDPTGDPSGTTMDPSLGTSSGAIDPSTTESGDLTTGPPMDDPYPNCTGPGMCAEATEECAEYENWVGTVIANLCVPPCSVDADCPMPASGDAMPVCPEGLGFCRLSCAGGLSCPEQMDCYDIGSGNYRCAYTL